MAQLSSFRLNLILHLVVFVWGFTGILGKLIQADQYVLVWWRMMIAFICLGIYLLLTRQSVRVSKADLFRLLGTGLIIALHWIFFYGAIKISNVSIAVACMAVASFFTAFLGPVFFKTRLVRYEILLSIGVIIGVAILMGVETVYMSGIIWGLISAFFAAVFTVFNAFFVRKINAVVISFYEMIGGFIGLTVYVLLSGKFSDAGVVISESDTYYLLLLGVFCTAIPFVISVQIMKQLSPYTVSLSVNMEPVYTILLALLFFPADEKMSSGFYFGLMIILSTVVLNAWLKSRKLRA